MQTRGFAIVKSWKSVACLGIVWFSYKFIQCSAELVYDPCVGIRISRLSNHQMPFPLSLSSNWRYVSQIQLRSQPHKFLIKNEIFSPNSDSKHITSKGRKCWANWRCANNKTVWRTLWIDLSLYCTETKRENTANMFCVSTISNSQPHNNGPGVGRHYSQYIVLATDNENKQSKNNNNNNRIKKSENFELWIIINVQ